MYADLTAEELIDWEIGYAVDPWGEERAETLHGIMCNLVDACHRAKGQPHAPLEYMPFVRALREAAGAQSEEEMQAIWQEAVKQWGE